MALDVMQLRNPEFRVPSPVPVGNWLAHQIRLIQDDSKHVFPASAGSKRSWDKYNSTTHKDFCGPRPDWSQWSPDFNSMVSHLKFYLCCCDFLMIFVIFFKNYFICL